MSGAFTKTILPCAGQRLPWSSSKVTTDIHALVQDVDYVQSDVRLAPEHDVRTRRVLEEPVAHRQVRPAFSPRASASMVATRSW